MNTRLNILATTSAALLLGLAWTGNTMAQQDSLDMPSPEVNRASCDDVEWHRDLLSDYPWVAEACHEAIIVDGQKWARFEAEFQQYNRGDGTITSNFTNDSGRSLGSVTLKPGPDQRVQLDGRSTEEFRTGTRLDRDQSGSTQSVRFSELRRGQVLNFYAPEGMYAFTTQPGAPEREQVEIVEPVTTDDRASDDQSSIARTESDRTERPTTLPATAGPLPIIALGGMLSLLGGVALTTRRRRKTLNA